MYVIPPTVSENAVAIAAPTNPKGVPNINMGSNTKLIAFVIKLTLRGVTVFNNPRYAADPVAPIKLGTIPSALHRRYGAAYSIAGALAGNNNVDSTCLGKHTSSSVPNIPNTLQTNIDSQTRSCASCVLPDDTADATFGAVRVGRNAIRKNIVKDA